MQTKATLQTFVQGSAGSTIFVNDQNLLGKESHSLIALRNSMFWKNAIGIY